MEQIRILRLATSGGIHVKQNILILFAVLELYLQRRTKYSHEVRPQNHENQLCRG
jgi:hypothetical protein